MGVIGVRKLPTFSMDVEQWECIQAFGTCNILPTKYIHIRRSAFTQTTVLALGMLWNELKSADFLNTSKFRIVRNQNGNMAFKLETGLHNTMRAGLCTYVARAYSFLLAHSFYGVLFLKLQFKIVSLLNNQFLCHFRKMWYEWTIRMTFSKLISKVEQCTMLTFLLMCTFVTHV